MLSEFPKKSEGDTTLGKTSLMRFQSKAPLLLANKQAGNRQLRGYIFNYSLPLMPNGFAKCQREGEELTDLSHPHGT